MGADNNDISATQTKVTRDFGLLPRGVFARGEGEFPLLLFQKGVRLKKKKKGKKNTFVTFQNQRQMKKW